MAFVGCYKVLVFRRVSYPKPLCQLVRSSGTRTDQLPKNDMRTNGTSIVQTDS